MARVAGESGEVAQMGKNLKGILGNVLETTAKGEKLLSELANTSKDKSYDTADGVVKEVQGILKNSITDCAEVAQKLKAYSEFLKDLEQG